MKLECSGSQANNLKTKIDADLIKGGSYGRKVQGTQVYVAPILEFANVRSEY